LAVRTGRNFVQVIDFFYCTVTDCWGEVLVPRRRVMEVELRRSGEQVDDENRVH